MNGRLANTSPGIEFITKEIRDETYFPGDRLFLTTASSLQFIALHQVSHKGAIWDPYFFLLFINNLSTSLKYKHFQFAGDLKTNIKFIPLNSN